MATELQRLARRWKCTAVAALFVAASSLTAMVLVLAFPIRIGRVTDEPLIGTWQSDADHTIAGISEQKPLDDKQEAALRKMFGKMLVTYTPATFATDLDGTIDTHKYEVLGKDKHSVVIREVERKPSPLDDFESSEFIVIQFDGPDSYWLYTQIGGIREHFKRIQ